MNAITNSKEDVRVLIFKSTIKTAKDVIRVNQTLSKIGEIKRWVIDLEDWEKVLKVETHDLSYQDIERIISRLGYRCSEMDH